MMVKQLFFEISEAKREMIISTAMAEFSEHGFELSSTNRIVKKAGISKGSLFKYFETKEDLYFYLIERIVDKLSSNLITPEDDLFIRIRQYAESEFNFFLENPVEYAFIKRAFQNDHSEISKKTYAKYTNISEHLFVKLCDTPALHNHEKKGVFINILKWLITGLNEEFTEGNQVGSPTKMKEAYMTALDSYLSVLKKTLEVL